MNKLLLDLWHDLRAKRLWPVAALLVVALVAVPLALRKGSSSGSPSPAASASAPASPADKAVVVADTNTSKNSNLNDFSTKNPFQPDHAVLAAAHPKPAAPSKTSTPSGGSGAGSGSGGASSPSSGNPGGSSGGAPVQPLPQQPRLTFFGYTIDLKFGKFGSTTLHRGVQKLAILPNQTNPLLIFLGVNTAENTAVFLLDSKLTAAGEGSCKPNADTCSFLYLKVDPNHNSEELSLQNADGTSTDYSVELLAIHRVPLDQLKKSAKTAQKAAQQAIRHARQHGAPTPFEVPFGVTVQPDAVG